MSFLSPLFLWSLVALLPLAAIYFLKVRPRRRTTTAYFLWEKIFTEKKANSLLSKLRDLLSLVLLALAFLFLSLALARPTFENDERRDLLLLIDVSASMATQESGKSRLDLAIERARGIVRSLNGNQRAAIVTLGESLQFASNLTESPRELLESLERVTLFPGPLSESVLSGLIDEESQWGEDLRVIFISDGQFERERFEISDKVEILRVGGKVENAGLVMADLQRLPNGTLGFYFQVASSFESPVTADLVLRYESGGGQVFKLIPLQIEPGKNDPEFFEIEEAGAGRWIAELELEDSFTEDNQVYLTVNEPSPVGVFVAAEERYFYETSVLAFEAVGETLKLVRDLTEAEVVIHQGASETAAVAKLGIHFAPEGDSRYWEEVGNEVVVEVARPRVKGHPALRFLDLDSISFEGARDLKVPKNASTLVESESGVPLIYQVSDPDLTVLVVNMNPLQAGFYFSAWFPTFLYSASTHLAGRESSLVSTYQPGMPIPLPGVGAEESFVYAEPGQEGREVAVRDGLGKLKALGFHSVESGGTTWEIGSSLVSLVDSMPLGEVLETTVEDLAMGRGVSYWLIALAILILASESLLYHMRKVG